MVVVKPFKGLRPPKSLVEQVASRPYDVLSSDEAKAEAGDNEKSLYHIIKPEIEFPNGFDEYDPQIYERAKENFEKFQNEHWLVQDDTENYYLYAQEMNGKTQYGIVLCTYVPDYMNGVIKKHELTRRDKEDDRMRHVRITNANVEPVFLAYRHNEVLDRLIRKYAAQPTQYDFIAPGDGFGHKFWVIGDEADKQAITAAFASMDALYIADGHHRSAAAALVGAEKAAAQQDGKIHGQPLHAARLSECEMHELRQQYRKHDATEGDEALYRHFYLQRTVVTHQNIFQHIRLLCRNIRRSFSFFPAGRP